MFYLKKIIIKTSKIQCQCSFILKSFYIVVLTQTIDRSENKILKSYYHLNLFKIRPKNTVTI